MANQKNRENKSFTIQEIENMVKLLIEASQSLENEIGLIDHEISSGLFLLKKMINNYKS